MSSMLFNCPPFYLTSSGLAPKSPIAEGPFPFNSSHATWHAGTRISPPELIRALVLKNSDDDYRENLPRQQSRDDKNDHLVNDDDGDVGSHDQQSHTPDSDDHESFVHLYPRQNKPRHARSQSALVQSASFNPRHARSQSALVQSDSFNLRQTWSQSALVPSSSNFNPRRRSSHQRRSSYHEFKSNEAPVQRRAYTLPRSTKDTSSSIDWRGVDLQMEDDASIVQVRMLRQAHPLVRPSSSSSWLPSIPEPEPQLSPTSASVVPSNQTSVLSVPANHCPSKFQLFLAKFRSRRLGNS
jgi:hypothetical protein